MNFFTSLHHGVSASAITARLGGTVTRYLLTVQGGAVSSSLTAFPLYVDLAHMPGGFWSLVNATGGNIRVKNAAGTVIPIDLAYFDKVTHTGTLFIRTDLSSTSATVLTIEVGASSQARLAVDNANGRNAVWVDFDYVTLLGTDARDRTGKEDTRSSGDTAFLSGTVVNTFSTDPHQGGTFDGTHHYIVDNNTITKYDAAWTLVATNADPIGATGLTTSPMVNHLGDPCNKDGLLYIPLEYYNAGVHSGEHIAVFSCSGLSFVTAYNISAQNKEVSSICYCPRDSLFYVTDYTTHTIQKYSSGFAHVGAFSFSTVAAPVNMQGIEWFDEAFWIVCDDLDEVLRVEYDGTSMMNPTSTTGNGYFGTSVTGNLEGIWKVNDSLYTLSDPTSANSFATKYANWNSPLSAGFGYQQAGSAGQCVVAYTLPSRTVFTMAASAKITSKSGSNKALISYVDEVTGSGSNQRVTLGYRVTDLTFGLWDVTNTWLLPGTDVDPSTSTWNRYHAQYNGTTRRELFVNGVSVAAQNTITAKGASMTAFHIGREDRDDNETFTGEIGFAYLYPGVLSAAWLAAEYSNLNAPSSFYKIADPDPYWDYTLAVFEFEASAADNNASPLLSPNAVYTAPSNSLTAAGGGKSGKGVQGTSTAGIRTATSHTVWSLGRATDFTWECFVYRTTVSDSPFIWYFDSPGSDWNAYLKVSSANKLTFSNRGNGGSTVTLVDPGDFPLSEWVYVCVERTGDTFRLYKAAAADANTTNVVKTTTTQVGFRAASSTAAILNTITALDGPGWLANSGKMDGYRYTKAARYSSDSGYPVPTLPYPIGTITQSMPPKPNLIYHFDASSGVFSDVAGTVAATDGDTVGLWSNLGQREDAVQNTAARRPTFHTGGLNGKPYLQCDKTTQQYFEDLNLYETGGLIDMYARSIFVVAEDIDVTNTPTFFGVSHSGGRGSFYLRPTTDQQINMAANNWRSGNVTNPFICGFRQDRLNDINVNVNGAEWTVSNGSNVNATTSTSLQFLRNTGLGAAPAGFFHGKIYEVLYYDGLCDAQTLSSIVDYLMEKYGVENKASVSKMSDYTILKQAGASVSKQSAYTVFKP